MQSYHEIKDRTQKYKLLRIWLDRVVNKQAK